MGRGGGFGLGGEPGVEGEGEGVELDTLGVGVRVMDLFEVELAVLEDGIVDAASVIEDVAGAGAVGGYDGGGEAEVGVVVDDFLVYGLFFEGVGDEGDLGSLGGAAGEEATVEIFVGGGGFLASVGGSELDADVIEDEGLIAIVGDDDADGGRSRG